MNLLTKTLFLSGLLICALSCNAIGQDIPGAATTPDPNAASSQPSTSSLWTNPPKTINPATRDGALEALPAAPTGDSVITGPASDMDQNQHTVVCAGKPDQEVTVVGNNFRMRCITLYVYFNKDNKIDHMIAVGDVVIEQPDRLTKAGHAVFFQIENKIILTDNPEIYDDGRHIKGDVITIYRGKNTMTVTNSQMIIPGSSATSTTTATSSPSP